MTTRSFFASQLTELEKELSEMSDMVVKAIKQSTDALIEHDKNLAKNIIDNDELINQKRWHIENMCNHLIATQQPVATNLREILAILNIISDLERIADHAKGNAKIAQMMNGSNDEKLIDFQKLSSIALQMLLGSIDAFLKRDPELAQTIIKQDDEIDALSHALVKEKLKWMIQHPQTIESSTYLIWVIHNFERIGDRATNICERVLYLVLGTVTDSQ